MRKTPEIVILLGLLKHCVFGQGIKALSFFCPVLFQDLLYSLVQVRFQFI